MARQTTRVVMLGWTVALLVLVALARCTGTGRWSAADWNTPIQYLDGFYCDTTWTLASMKATADGHNWPLF
jgi:hypothetical protein